MRSFWKAAAFRLSGSIWILSGRRALRCFQIELHHFVISILKWYYLVTDTDIDIDTLQDYLGNSLPKHMLPAAFVVLDQIPLTPNGKIDRKALLKPEYASLDQQPVAPSNVIEEILLGIWSEVLNIDDISINDDFFALGGHSLTGMKIVTRINSTFRISMSIRTLFDKPEFQQMAEEVLKSISADELEGAHSILKCKRANIR